MPEFLSIVRQYTCIRTHEITKDTKIITTEHIYFESTDKIHKHFVCIVWVVTLL